MIITIRSRSNFYIWCILVINPVVFQLTRVCYSLCIWTLLPAQPHFSPIHYSRASWTLITNPPIIIWQSHLNSSPTFSRDNRQSHVSLSNSVLASTELLRLKILARLTCHAASPSVQYGTVPCVGYYLLSYVQYATAALKLPAYRYVRLLPLPVVPNSCSNFNKRLPTQK